MKQKHFWLFVSSVVAVILSLSNYVAMVNALEPSDLKNTSSQIVDKSSFTNISANKSGYSN